MKKTGMFLVKFRTVFALLVSAAVVGCSFNMDMSGESTIVPAKSMRVTRQAPSVVTAGETISPAMVVTYLDEDGKPDVKANQAITVSLATSPAGATLQNSLVKRPVDGVTTFDDLNIKKSGTGYTLTFTSENGLTATSDPFEVKPAPPTSIQIAGGPTSVTAGDCHLLPVSYNILDQYGNQSPFSQATAVNLSGNGLVFYSDAACSNSITSQTLTSGQHSGVVYLIGNIAGTQTLTLASAGLTSASQQITVIPSNAKKLAFTSAAKTLVAGTCSSAVTVQTQDLVGNASKVDADQSITLTGTGLTFYTDAACAGTAVTDVTVPQGTSSTLFYFKGTTSGAILLGGTAPGFNSASQTENINPAAATHLAFKVQPSHTVAGVAVNPAIEVSILDQFENIASLSSATITLNIGNNPPGAATIVGGAKTKSTTNGVAVFSGAQDIKIETAGVGYTLTATAPSMTAIQSNSFNILAAAAHHLTYLSSPQTLRAGTCSAAVQVEVRDIFDNPAKVSAITQLGFSGQNISIFPNSSCTGGLKSRVWIFPQRVVLPLSIFREPLLEIQFL